MARIPQAEIERLKAEVSLVRLIEDAGVTLRRQGKGRQRLENQGPDVRYGVRVCIQRERPIQSPRGKELTLSCA